MRARYPRARGERGDALPLALMAMAVAALLVSPMLLRISQGFKVTERVERTTHQEYASDAGAEFALWKLSHDPAFRQTLIGNISITHTLAMPEIVNARSVPTMTLEVMCLSTTQGMGSGGGGGDGESGGDGEGGGGDGGEGGIAGETEYLQFVIWGDSTTRNNTVQIGGSGHSIYGGIHSNNELKLSGSGHTIYHGDSTVESVEPIEMVGSGHQIIPGPPQQGEVEPFPLLWNIEDFAPGGALAEAAAAEGKYYYHSSNWSFSGSGGTVPEGIHFCERKAHISGSGHTGRITIVARDTIDISGSGHEFTPYVPGLSFFSDKTATSNVVSISGSGNMGGTCYAPNGKVSLTGSGGVITGAFMGQTVDINGSGATFNLAEVVISSGDEGGGDDGGDDGGGDAQSGDTLVTWALWANSTSRADTVYLNGSGQRVYGDVHSNKDIHIYGSDDDIEGDVERVGQLLVEGSGNDIIPGPATTCDVAEMPVSWDIVDFQPDGSYAVAADAEGKYYHHVGDWTFSGSGLTIPEGLHYVSGNATLSGSDLTGNVTIVASGEIHVDGSGHQLTAYISGLTLYANQTSSDAVLTLSGSGTQSLGGIAYAPEGRITVSGSGLTIYGALLGDSVELYGNSITIDNSAGITVSGTGGVTCGVYDIRSVAGGATTTARVRLCEGGDPEVLYWYVE